jgi:hypothetical protein
MQGSPESITINHVLLVTDSESPIGQGPLLSKGPNHQLNHIFTNSNFVSGPTTGVIQAGWYNTSLGEGTKTQLFNTDAGSLTATYLIWAQRPNTSYTEYGNNTNYTDPNGCSGSGCAPPVSGANANWFFPATPYCTGASVPTYTGPGTSCVGFVGAMSTSSMPLTLSDYNGFALRSDSPGHNAASDGTDIGPRIANINSAQTSTIYVCGTPCGTGPGPFPR